MTLRSAPLDVKTRRKLTSFESETKQDVKLIADLLQSGKTGSAKTVEFADSVFYRITKLMMKRHNEERDFLHPLFLQVNRTA